MHLARGSATSTTDGDSRGQRRRRGEREMGRRERERGGGEEVSGGGRRVQFPEPLFTNRIIRDAPRPETFSNGVPEEGVGRGTGGPNDVCRPRER